MRSVEINNLGREEGGGGMVESDLEIFLLALKDFCLNLRIIWQSFRDSGANDLVGI